MAGRMLAFVLAGVMAACSSAKEGVEPQVAAGSLAQPLTASSTPEAKLRDSFQPCVDKAAGATWPTQDCIGEEFEYQDARLNKTYQALMKALPEERRAELRTRERQWLSARGASCPWDEDTGGQAGRIESNYCVMRKTALRADELEVQLTAITSTPTLESRSAEQQLITSGFVAYASQGITGTSLTCVVGALTDEDGMNQRPVVKLVGDADKTSWTTKLRVPTEYYQGRATHCTSFGQTLFVLLQFDTQPAQTLAQTQLQVVKLALNDGAIQQTTAIDVPGVTKPYSAWVPDVPSGFSLQTGKLVVLGRFFIVGDEAHQRSFRATLDPAGLH